AVGAPRHLSKPPHPRLRLLRQPPRLLSVAAERRLTCKLPRKNMPRPPRPRRKPKQKPPPSAKRWRPKPRAKRPLAWKRCASRKPRARRQKRRRLRQKSAFARPRRKCRARSALETVDAPRQRWVQRPLRRIVR